MNLTKRFLTESKDIVRASSLWNIIASILVAIQPVLMLIVVSRTAGNGMAGIYAIGNTYASLFMAIGKFGTRGFQASDIKGEYEFYDYRGGRIISCVFMIVAAVIFISYLYMTRNYTVYKMVVLLTVSLFRVPDAYEDVYHGEFQKNGRLDIASKWLAIRTFITTIGLVLLLVITKDLLIAFVYSTVVSLVIMLCFLHLTKEYAIQHTSLRYQNFNKNQFNCQKVKKLMLTILPLAVVTFLSLYINSSPRNSIDKYLTSEEQSIFGYISMPFFVVELLVLFLLNPVYHKLACMWDENRMKEYSNELLKFSLLNVVISIVCIILVYLFGDMVLSFVYNTDLSAYKTDLIILMGCGGMYSFSTLLYCFMIIMRKQKLILFTYVFVAMVATIASDFAVKKGGIRGASLLYLLLLSLLVVIFIIEFIVSFSARKRSLDNKKSTEDFQL